MHGKRVALRTQHGKHCPLNTTDGVVKVTLDTQNNGGEEGNLAKDSFNYKPTEGYYNMTRILITLHRVIF